MVDSISAMLPQKPVWKEPITMVRTKILMSHGTIHNVKKQIQGHLSLLMSILEQDLILEIQVQTVLIPIMISLKTTCLLPSVMVKYLPMEK
ncbi:hypothetical protein D3C87_1225330 [compost metagenome]